MEVSETPVYRASISRAQATASLTRTPAGLGRVQSLRFLADCPRIPPSAGGAGPWHRPSTRRPAERAGPGRRQEIRGPVGTAGTAPPPWSAKYRARNTSSPRTRQRRPRERRGGARPISTRQALGTLPPTSPFRPRPRLASNGPAGPVTATRRRNHRTAGRKGPVRAPPTTARMADHYHSASEHGIIGRQIETIVAGRFRRRHPGL